MSYSQSTAHLWCCRSPSLLPAAHSLLVLPLHLIISAFAPQLSTRHTESVKVNELPWLAHGVLRRDAEELDRRVLGPLFSIHHQAFSSHFRNLRDCAVFIWSAGQAVDAELLYSRD